MRKQMWKKCDNQNREDTGTVLRLAYHTRFLQIMTDRIKDSNVYQKTCSSWLQGDCAWTIDLLYFGELPKCPFTFFFMWDWCSWMKSAKKDGTYFGKRRKKTGHVSKKRRKRRDTYRKTRYYGFACRKMITFADGKSDGSWCPVFWLQFVFAYDR